MVIYSIYKATNKINGKSYIGFDSAWPRRKYDHKSRAKRNCNYYFHNAIRKYGWDAFEWNVLYQSKVSLLDMEETFIQLYNSRENGYNVASGGSAPWLGRKRAPFSAETIEKMRKRQLGKKLSQPAIEKMRKANLGKKMSLEAREKMSKAKLGNKNRLGGKKYLDHFVGIT